MLVLVVAVVEEEDGGLGYEYTMVYDVQYLIFAIIMISQVVEADDTTS